MFTFVWIQEESRESESHSLFGFRLSKQPRNQSLSQGLQTSVTHPDVPFIRSTNTPLRVDAQRALGLVLGHGTHSRSLVRTCHMAGEVTHWTGRQTETNQRFDWSSVRF